MVKICVANRNRWNVSIFVLLLLPQAGCEEVGSVNKSAAEPAGEKGAESDLSQMKPGILLAPPVEAPIEFPKLNGEAAASSNRTPEHFLATFRARASQDITDEDLEKIANMAPANAEILSLDLKGAQITGKGLAQLSHLPYLRRVNLTGCGITGTEWEGISTATQLEHLNLEGTAVDDASLAAIGSLVKLKSLNLNRTKVTDVQELKTKLPDCKILFMGMEF